MGIAYVGETLEKTVRFNAQEIAEFAALCGDTNPLHHDAAFAAKSRFGGIIASGLQTMSVWMAMVASHYSKSASMVGLGGSFAAKGPAFANTDIDMRWTVVSVEEKPKTGSEIVRLEGTVTGPDGAPILEGTFTAMVTPRT